MDFTNSEERRLIGDSLARYLREQYTLDVRERAVESTPGYSETAWQALGEMGIIGALIDPAHGGFGGEGFDLTLVFEALGRVLSIEPWLATGVLSLRALADGGDPLGLVPAIVAGDTTVAFAHGEADSGYVLPYVTSSAVRNGKGWLLTGHKAVVLHADSADYLIVSARTSGEPGDENGLSLFIVERRAPGVSVRGYTTIDGFRAAEVVLDAVNLPAAQLVGEVDTAFASIERATSAATLAVCAEALGAMEEALNITLDYLRTREQFGQPIGRFQVLQHRMVDVATAIEQSRSLVIKAASDFGESRQQREASVSAAKYYIGVAARLVAEEATQMHGGIGLAKATPISQYVKRLVMLDHLFGDTDHHLERYVALTR